MISLAAISYASFPGNNTNSNVFVCPLMELLREELPLLTVRCFVIRTQCFKEMRVSSSQCFLKSKFATWSTALSKWKSPKWEPGWTFSWGVSKAAASFMRAVWEAGSILFISVTWILVSPERGFFVTWIDARFILNRHHPVALAPHPLQATHSTNHGGVVLGLAWRICYSHWVGFLYRNLIKGWQCKLNWNIFVCCDCKSTLNAYCAWKI